MMCCCSPAVNPDYQFNNHHHDSRPAGGYHTLMNIYFLLLSSESLSLYMCRDFFTWSSGNTHDSLYSVFRSHLIISSCLSWAETPICDIQHPVCSKSSLWSHDEVVFNILSWSPESVKIRWNVKLFFSDKFKRWTVVSEWISSFESVQVHVDSLTDSLEEE